jgi:hypothetical protein
MRPEVGLSTGTSALEVCSRKRADQFYMDGRFESAGEIGLMEFMRLDAGTVLAKAHVDGNSESIRLIIGNPLIITHCKLNDLLHLLSYVAARLMSSANLLIFGLPMAASTAATTVSNGFCEVMLHRRTLIVRISVIMKPLSQSAPT